MIRCVVTRADSDQGLIAVVKKLRAAGIPARASGNDIRLCQVWEGASQDTLVGGRCIGYGRLEWTEDSRTHDVEFRYYQPPRMGKYGPIVEDENVIDVEAREIIDTPLITNEHRN